MLSQGHWQETRSHAGIGGVKPRSAGPGSQEGVPSHEAARSPFGKRRQEEGVVREEMARDADTREPSVSEFHRRMFMSQDGEWRVSRKGEFARRLLRVIPVAEVEASDRKGADDLDGQAPLGNQRGEAAVMVAGAENQIPSRQRGAECFEHGTQGFERHGPMDEIPENDHGAGLVFRTEFPQSDSCGVGGLDGKQESPGALGPGVSEVEVRDGQKGVGFQKRGTPGVEGPSAIQPDPLRRREPLGGFMPRVR